MRPELPSGPALPRLEHRPHVDGLRGVAVLAVVAYHAGLPWVPGGYVGVDVFFVISGFLITGLLLGEFERRGDISLTGFYERRLRRLAPALFLVLLATLAMGAIWLVPIGGEQQGLAKSTLATLGLVSNLHFAASTGGYFDGPAESQLLLHTWSLSVEEQFYLVWPLVLLLAARLGQRTRAGPAGACVVVLALALASSLLWSIIWTDADAHHAFFAASTRVWEFAAGGLAFIGVRARPGRAPRLGAVIASLGLLVILVTVTVFSKATAFPGYQAAWPVFGTVAVIVGCEYAPEGWTTRLLDSTWLVFVGLVSYSLYLWHWPLLTIARLDQLGELSAVATTAVCMLSFLLAAFSYRFVEQPFRKRRVAWISTPRRAFGAGALAACSIAAIAVALGVLARAAWVDDSQMSRLQTSLREMRKVRVACGQPPPYDGTLPQGPQCTLPDAKAVPMVALWGDSHAAHLVPGVTEALVTAKGSARIRYMPECPPLLGYSPALVGLLRPRGCEQFNADVALELAELRRSGLEMVLLSARWTGYVRGEGRAAARQSLQATLRTLVDAGIRPIVVAPSPQMPHEVPACLARRNADTCRNGREQAETIRRDALELIREAVAAVAGSAWVDPFPVLCDARECPAVHAEQVLYSDSHHLTEAASRRLGPALAAAMLSPPLAHSQDVRP